MPAKQYKYDLSAFLKAMRYKNEKYYGLLSEDEQKAVAPLIVMRAMTATTNAKQVFFINELVNPFVFTLGKHKELLIDLITLCPFSGGRYLKNEKELLKKATKLPECQAVIMEYFGYNSVNATDAIAIISNDDIMRMAEELGRDIKIIKLIKKELKSKK